MSRKIYLEFLNRNSVQARPHLRLINNDQVGPTQRSIYKILENVRIQQSDTHAIKYLAIGRHIVWMLCDARIVPFKGTSNPDCFDIMLQAHPSTPTPNGTIHRSNPRHDLHHIESKSQLDLHANALHRLHSGRRNPASDPMEGSLGVACIFEDAAINFPCGGLNVDIPVPGMAAVWKVGILVRFKIPD
jgi:hypothetical protein